METAKPARSIEKVVDLETFLVEWKLYSCNGCVATEYALKPS